MVVPWYITDGADNLMSVGILEGIRIQVQWEGRHVTGIFHDKDMVMKLKSDLVQTTDRALVNDKRKERGGGGDDRVFEY